VWFAMPPKRKNQLRRPGERKRSGFRGGFCGSASKLFIFHSEFSISIALKPSNAPSSLSGKRCVTQLSGYFSQYAKYCENGYRAQTLH
jgi:hypothetical protein